jgi:hypothetical protein
VRGALEGFGVDTRWVGTDPVLRTPIVFCELHPPDRFPLLFCREPKTPDLNIAPEELDRDGIAYAALVWTTGIGLCQEPSRSATLAALEGVLGLCCCGGYVAEEVARRADHQHLCRLAGCGGERLNLRHRMADRPAVAPMREANVPLFAELEWKDGLPGLPEMETNLHEDHTTGSGQRAQHLRAPRDGGLSRPPLGAVRRSQQRGTLHFPKERRSASRRRTCTSLLR